MAIEIFKAVLVGIIAAIPVGPVLLMVIQKTLSRGAAAGIMTGFGSAFADTAYAAVGLFTLAVVENFIERNQALIMIVGGVLIFFIGVGMFRRRVDLRVSESLGKLTLAGCSAQAAGSAFSNPAALAFVFGLLSLFGFGQQDLSLPVWAVLVCVFAGELLYWTIVVFVLSRYVRLSPRVIDRMSKVAGTVVCCFAAVLTVRGILFLI